MTAPDKGFWRATASVESIASIAITLALVALLLLHLPQHGRSSAKPPPPDAEPVQTPRGESSGPPPMIALPPPPRFAEPALQSDNPPPERQPKQAVPAAQSVASRVADLKQGRVLLRKLEAGDGPTIEIAWPASRREREALYAVFTKCHGMVSAVMDARGRLFRAIGEPGATWRLNADRYSLFLRRNSGAQIDEETRILNSIRTHHGIGGGVPVRLFPREVDALFLGTLHKSLGATADPGAAIRARYRLAGDGVRITDLTIGGRMLNADIPLHNFCG